MIELNINRKNLHVYCISDAHIGSNCFNQDYFEHCLEVMRKDKHQKRIILNGDILEIASRNVGNSAFSQNIDVNEQLEIAIQYFKPLRKHIIGVTKGNHDSARILKDYDFDVTQVFAEALGCESVNQFNETLLINDKNYKIFATHGKGSSGGKPHLSLGKIVRETEYIDADLVFYGHIHRAESISETKIQGDKYKRRYYVATGHFLSYANSYAASMGLPPSAEAFTRVNIDKNLVTSVDIFNIDEVCPEFVKV